LDLQANSFEENSKQNPYNYIIYEIWGKNRKNEAISRRHKRKLLREKEGREG
jgi:hypothetical protein